ncbi:MAG: BrnT family toxin [Anaerolineae bacterium]
MQFEWDEQKNQANIRRRGLDFADAAQVFDGPMIVNLDTRQGYEEERWIGIGMTHGRVVVIVYTERDDTIRIISMRKALKHERKRYYEEVFGN